MKKRIVTMIISVGIISGVLLGCGSSSASEEETKVEESTVVEETEAETETETEKTEDNDDEKDTTKTEDVDDEKDTIETEEDNEVEAIENNADLEKFAEEFNSKEVGIPSVYNATARVEGNTIHYDYVFEGAAFSTSYLEGTTDNSSKKLYDEQVQELKDAGFEDIEAVMHVISVDGDEVFTYSEE